jgi:hypothetical protein
MSESLFTGMPDQRVENTSQRRIGDFLYEIIEDGAFVFEDEMNIGGDVDVEGGSVDFRDYLVSHERVGVRTDATLVLPKGTAMTAMQDGSVEFVLPRTKVKGVIQKIGNAIYATPES